MVIGTFYSEVGTSLLADISRLDPDAAKISGQLKIDQEWTAKEFARTSLKLKAHHYNVNCDQEIFARLRETLIARRQFMLTLLENPNLLEHETFTDLLWAVFHLTEELAFRKRFNDQPESDCRHLSGDIKRAYRLLVLEWLAYMKHLKNNYPYLFSLAIRTNPFDSTAQVIVKD